MSNARPPEPSPNPYTPGFGRPPRELIGRTYALDRFDNALRIGGGEHFLIDGHRGMGKTVLLGALGDMAREQGWIVLEENGRPGAVDRLINSEIPLILRDIAGGKTHRATIDKVNVTKMIGVQLAREPVHPAIDTLGSKLTELVAAVEAARSGTGEAGRRTGVVLAVDEIEPASLPDMSVIADYVQRLSSHEVPVIFIGAGLSHNINALLQQDHVTFLRRSARFPLAQLDPAEVADSFARAFAASGREFTETALDMATLLSQRHPYLVQTLGSVLWDHAPTPVIDTDTVAAIVPEFQHRLSPSLHEPTLRHVTRRAADYLEALATHGAPAHSSALLNMLNMGKQQASKLRTDLVKIGVLDVTRDNKVFFAIPYLQDYIRAHGAHIDTNPTQYDQLSDILSLAIPHPEREQPRNDPPSATPDASPTVGPDTDIEQETDPEI